MAMSNMRYIVDAVQNLVAIFFIEILSLRVEKFEWMIGIG
jgi:hypothetical protein